MNAWQLLGALRAETGEVHLRWRCGRCKDWIWTTENVEPADCRQCRAEDHRHA